MKLTLVRIAKTRIFMPWNNLGCLGFKIPGRYYVDFFKRWGPWWHFGMYVHSYQGRWKRWYSLPSFRITKKEPR